MSERRIIKTSQVTPLEPTANVLNTHSTSQTDTYSANYINNNVGKEIYSATEQVIGTWIDGKPLYRKVITGTLGESGTTDVTITDVLPMTCDIVNITGSITAMNGANKQARPISLYLNYSSQENFISFILLGQNATRYDLKFFYTSPYAESGFNMILEYTKSTDTANS